MINGIINIYKERGYTSHDVVAKLRGIAGQKKVGHTGTLDPEATGVLPVCLGKGTKVCELLTDWNKTYEATLLLGVDTDTQDLTGCILSKSSGEALDKLTEEKLREVIMGFIGIQDQLPPMYSAVKIGGKKLCDLARKGIDVERKTRKITIHDIEILEMNVCRESGDGLKDFVSYGESDGNDFRGFPRIRMKVTCSKGTYIRTLCHDIGERLGVGGCMEKLIRTRVGIFQIDDAATLGELHELKKEGKLLSRVVNIDEIFKKYPAVYVGDEYRKLLIHGGFIPITNEESICAEIVDDSGEDEVTDGADDPGEDKSIDGVDDPGENGPVDVLDGSGEDEVLVRLYDMHGEFFGVYRKIPHYYRPVKFFHDCTEDEA